MVIPAISKSTCIPYLPIVRYNLTDHHWLLQNTARTLQGILYKMIYRKEKYKLFKG